MMMNVGWMMMTIDDDEWMHELMDGCRCLYVDGWTDVQADGWKWMLMVG